MRIAIQFPNRALAGCSIGASVALNGCCATITHVDDVASVAHFDIVAETLQRTNLSELSEGTFVNFERSARVGDEVGGHLVSGHVHDIATLDHVHDAGEGNVKWLLKTKEHTMRYVFHKGYIALDGASLTVGETGTNWFVVYLIPETLRATTFAQKEVGSRCNVEIDMQTQAVVDTVEQYMASRGY